MAPHSEFVDQLFDLDRETCTVGLVYENGQGSEVSRLVDWKLLGSISNTMRDLKVSLPKKGEFTWVAASRPIGAKIYRVSILLMGMGQLAQYEKQGLVSADTLKQLGKKIKSLGPRKWVLFRSEFAALEASYLREGLGKCSPAEIAIIG